MKYHNKKTVIDGITFASLKEANRYMELKLLQKVGQITEIECQPSFILQDKFITRDGEKIRAITYRGDFSYKLYKNPSFIHRIVEDVKGMRTEVYKLKRKLFLKKYPDIIFREI